MKKIRTLIAILAIAGSANAQGYFPEIEWSRCYGSSENDEAIDIKQTMDGGYIVLGRSASTDGDLIDAPFGNKTWIFKLDAQGNIEWQQYLPETYNNRPRNIIQAPDSGYIVGGSVFTKLKTNGDIDWQKNISGHSILIATDGEYVSTDLNTQTVTKFNISATSWIYDIDFFPAFGSLITVDSRILVYGGSYTSGGRAVVLDNNGNDSFKSIGVIDEYEIKRSMTGYISILPLFQYYAMLVYCNVSVNGSDGMWTHDLYPYRVLDAIENIDSSMIVSLFPSGLTQLISKDARLFKYARNSNDSVARQYGGSGIDKFSRIYHTMDGGYITLGSTTSNDGDVWGNHGNADIWVVKFSSDTSVHAPPPVLSVNEVSNMDEVKVYPNPSNGKIFVNLPEGYERAEIRVLNMLGQEVPAAHSRDGRKETVLVNDSPAGIYILEVNQGAQRKSFRVTLAP